jgi:hypothetical protein
MFRPITTNVSLTTTNACGSISLHPPGCPITHFLHGSTSKTGTSNSDLIKKSELQLPILLF